MVYHRDVVTTKDVPKGRKTFDTLYRPSTLLLARSFITSSISYPRNAFDILYLYSL